MKRLLKNLLLTLLFLSSVWIESCGNIPPPFTVTSTLPKNNGILASRDEFYFEFTATDKDAYPGLNIFVCPFSALTITSITGCETKPTIKSYGLAAGLCAFYFEDQGSCRSQDQIKLTLDLSKVMLVATTNKAPSTYSWGTYDLTVTISNTLPALPTNKVIFKTATAHDGNFGGISGVDSFCNSASNKPDSRTYKALISDETNRIACTTANCSGGASEHTDWVLAASTTYYNASGSVIGTTTSAGIFNFTSALTNAIGTAGDTVWTGLNTDWTPLPAEHCGSWQQNAGFGGQFGLDNSTTVTSIASNFGACTTSRYVYCVSQ